MSDYDRYVLDQARGISATLVEDAEKLDSFPQTDEGEVQYQEFELELRESCCGTCAWRDDNGMPCYEWQLAGPHFGQCNIRIRGLLDREPEDPYPKTAELYCLQNGRWTRVCPENDSAHLAIAYIVVGYTEDLLEEWEERLKEDRH